MQYTQLSRRSAGGKIDWEKQYLTFIPVEDAVFSWAERATGGHLEYSINGGQTWVTIADGESTPTITAGSKVIWRGDLKPNTTSGTGTFRASGNYNAYGNTMSLLFYDSYYGSQLDSATYNYVFYRLFSNDTHILSAPELPATILRHACYQQMFYGCSNLTIAPELPATILRQACYQQMFYECSNLTIAPTVLPATTTTIYCYLQMFYGCTSLTTAPALPATTLALSCYNSMFEGCTSLTTAPVLPAKTLAQSCYSYMFEGCTSLTTAPELPAKTLAQSCYSYMFEGCTSLTTAPELPATSITLYAYQYMFKGCTSLNYVKCLARYSVNATNLRDWLSGVAATGTFVKDASASYSTGASGIPSGWTVVDDNA